MSACASTPLVPDTLLSDSFQRFSLLVPVVPHFELEALPTLVPRTLGEMKGFKPPPHSNLLKKRATRRWLKEARRLRLELLPLGW